MTLIPEPTTRRFLSYSALKQWRFCQVAYQHQYVDQLRTVFYNPAFAHGDCLHAGAEAHRLGWDLGCALACGAAALAGHGNVTPDDAAKGASLIEAYYARYVADRLVSAHNEVEIKSHLGGQWWFYGRCDGIVFDLADRGRPWLYECKTTGGTVRDLELTLRQDPQIHLYQGMLRKQLGIECAGAILDVVKKPWSDDKEAGGAIKRRDKGKEPITDYLARCKEGMLNDPDRYFLRQRVEFDADRVDEAINELRCMAAGIERAERDGYHSIRGWNCKTPYGRWCEYKDLCWYGNASKYKTVDEYDGRKAITSNDDGNDKNGKQSNDDAAA